MSDLQKIKIALSFISPDCDRDTWLKIGMALHDETDDFDAFDSWSSGGDGYNAKHTLSVWKSFKKGGVTINSLFAIAKESGWTPEPGNKPSEEAMAKQRAEADRRRLAREAQAAVAASAAAGRAKAIWEAAEPVGDESHAYLKKKGVKAHGLRIGRWETIDSETGEVRLVSKHALLVPVCDRTKAVHSLQAIFSSKAMGGRDKDYLRDGAKSGHFHAIGKPIKHGDRMVFILGEGYATCASLYEATGHCVLVCFDASNLVTVAKAIRERLADAIILIGGDNDRWNRKPDGTPYNPGKSAAAKAGKDAGALIALPPFTDADQTGVDERGDPEGPTDWNDYHQLHGLEAINGLIMVALDGGDITPPEPKKQIPEPQEAPPEAPIELPSAPDSDAGVAMSNPPEIPNEDLDEVEHLQKNKYFTVLGYDHDEYFFFSHAKQQVMCRKRPDLKGTGLLELANDKNWWELNFPAAKDGIDNDAAFSWIIHVAHSRGVYDPTNVRGRGAWLDDGRVVYHLGDELLVDGQQVGIAEISSSYVYPRSRRMPRPAQSPLTKEEGRKIHEVARKVRWARPGSAVLVTGWTFLAPICGALKWRPHIWITGGAGSGKTTIQRDFCAALTTGFGRYAQGNSTEAGIRQALRTDALAMLIDEFESNNEREKQRTENVLSMIRQASSESQAETMKGTQFGDGMNFHIRSMFCLASINVNLEKQADRDRITKLSIRVPTEEESDTDHWLELESDLKAIEENEELPARMISRALGMMPTIIATVRVFTRAAAKNFRSQRMGDQYGTLIAGCWCMCNDAVPTEAEADAMISRYNWDEHTEDGAHDDAIEALQTIMSTKIKLGGSLPDVTMAEALREAHSMRRLGKIEQATAEDILSRNGIKLEEVAGRILVGISNRNLRMMLKDTPYSTDMRGQLLRIKGSARFDGTRSFGGVASRCISIPLEAALPPEDAPVVKPWADDDFPL